MLKDLSKYPNLGTPVYYFQLIEAIKESRVAWTINDLEKLFHSRIIDGNVVYDGCIKLALTIGILNQKCKKVELNHPLIQGSEDQEKLSQIILTRLFDTLSKDKTFYEIFNAQNLSYDHNQRSLVINNSAFGFKYSNLKQFLIDFHFLAPFQDQAIGNYHINSSFKNLLDNTILPEIRKRKIGIDELKKSLELRQKHGEQAERFVFQFEVKRLKNKKQISWVAEYVVNEGYDIASFNHTKDANFNRFIEVKSYSGNTPYFYWSRNEYLEARRKRDEYWLYLVNRDRMQIEDYQPIMIKNPYREILGEESKWFRQVENFKCELIE